MSGGNLSPLALIARHLVVIAAVVLTSSLLALTAVAAPKDASAQSCRGQLTIDFAGLPAGTILGEQYAGQGVHISAEANRDFPDALVVFDSNAAPTHDPDLAADIGNIAILANNLDDEDADGLVDDPDENNYGGRAIFAFDQAVSVGAFLFVDKDHGSADFAVAYDATGGVLASVSIPQAGNGSVQRIEVDADGVHRFELVYRDSAGFTGIEVDCGQPSPTPVITPSSTIPAAAAPPFAAAGIIIPAGTPTSPESAVAGAISEPRPSTEVLGALALPAGGGPRPANDPWFEWLAPLTVLIIALGASILFKFKRRQTLTELSK